MDRDNFCYNTVSPFLAGRDYYVSKDLEDPNFQGNIFESGAYNLETYQYSFITMSRWCIEFIIIIFDCSNHTEKDKTTE